MAELNIETVIKSGVEKALKKPIVDGKSITEWAAIGMKAPRWISVKDHLPESNKRVLASCDVRRLDGYRRRYTCVAFYAVKHSIPEGKYPEDDECYDYDEDEDEYYLKEGWYEVIHNWDEYSSVVIEDFVTHWMPLPEPPEEVTGDE